MTLDEQLKDAKARFSIATAEALDGDNSAWIRAEIHGREVRRLQAAIRAAPPKPQGPWAIAAEVREERERGEG